jgi:hypothetical protein
VPIGYFSHDHRALTLPCVVADVVPAVTAAIAPLAEVVGSDLVAVCTGVFPSPMVILKDEGNSSGFVADVGC